MVAIHRLLLPALLAVTSCQSSPQSSSPSSTATAAALPKSEFTLVFLKTGPRKEPLSDAERSQVMGGHMGNIQKLARERHLLVAGPYGKQKSDPTLRGLFVFDTAERSRAKELAEGDPGVQAGVFALDYHTIETAAPLRAFLAAELAAQEEAKKAGKEPSPADGIRGYVVVTAEQGDRAEQVLAGNPAVLMFARLDGTRAFAVLDAKDQVSARAILDPLAAKLGGFRLDEWFASSRLADLPKLAQ